MISSRSMKATKWFIHNNLHRLIHNETASVRSWQTRDRFSCMRVLLSVILLFSISFAFFFTQPSAIVPHILSIHRTMQNQNWKVDFWFSSAILENWVTCANELFNPWTIIISYNIVNRIRSTTFWIVWDLLFHFSIHAWEQQVFVSCIHFRLSFLSISSNFIRTVLKAASVSYFHRQELLC